MGLGILIKYCLPAKFAKNWLGLKAACLFDFWQCCHWLRFLGCFCWYFCYVMIVWHKNQRFEKARFNGRQTIFLFVWSIVYLQFLWPQVCIWADNKLPVYIYLCFLLMTRHWRCPALLSALMWLNCCLLPSCYIFWVQNSGICNKIYVWSHSCIEVLLK